MIDASGAIEHLRCVAEGDGAPGLRFEPSGSGVRRDVRQAPSIAAERRSVATALDARTTVGYGSTMTVTSATRTGLRAGVPILLLAVAIGAGCGGSSVPAPAPERTGLVAQPCQALAVGSGPLDPAKARVFVEVVELSTRDIPQPIGHWLDENTVTIRSSVNLVAFPNMETSMPWGQCVEAVCSATTRTLRLTPHLPELESEPIELTLSIVESPPEGAEGVPRTLLEASVRALAQQPIVLPPSPLVSDGSVVVTAYLLQRPDDLHRVMECKVQQGEREQRAR
jgi:hypothetical protein